MQKWLFLVLAIISEVVATYAIKSADGFTKFWPSAIVVSGYASAFYFFALTLKTIPLGIAYAIWSGVGTVFIALVAWVFMEQKLNLPTIVGILLIVSGVVVINLFSKPDLPFR